MHNYADLVPAAKRLKNSNDSEPSTSGEELHVGVISQALLEEKSLVAIACAHASTKIP